LKISKVRHKDTGKEDLIIVNSARSPPEMQTRPYYCETIIPTDKKFISRVTVYIHQHVL